MTDSTASDSPSPPADSPADAPRVLPSQAEIAQWAKGDDLPSLGTLFSGLPVARFDALTDRMATQNAPFPRPSTHPVGPA